MKRLLFILYGILISLGLSAQTIGDAFYIYRNDGGFNAFFREEVTKIEYSNYDLDSLLHDDIVTQVVFTEDSIYRIPIEVIDSVSFVQPETVYAKQVVQMGALIDYIIRVDGKTIYVSPDVPTALLPNVGEILLFEQINSLFPYGFAGRVSAINNGTEIEIVCTDVGIDEVYEQIVECQKIESNDGTNEVKKFGSDGNGGFSSKPYTLPMNFGADFLGAGVSLDGSITIKAHGRSTKRVGLGQAPYADIHITFDIDTECGFSVKEGFSLDRDLMSATLPVVLPYGLFAEITLASFIEGSVEGSLSSSFTTHSSHTYGAEHRNGKTECYSSKEQSVTPNEISLNGRASAMMGLKVEGAIGFLGELGKVTLGMKAGPLFTADFKGFSSAIDNNNGYEVNKDSKVSSSIHIEGYAKAGFYFKVLGFEVGKIEGSISPINADFAKKSWYIVPTFSNMKYQVGKDLTQALVSTSVSRDLLSPMTIGMALFDSNNRRVDIQAAGEKYQNSSSFSAPYTFTFENLTPGRTYTAYPYVKIMGEDYLASPSVKVGEDVMAETGDATEITAKTATLTGRVTGEDSSKHLFGIAYGLLDADDWTEVRSTQRDDNGQFSVQLSGLKNDTEYGYCTYIEMGQEYLLGDVRKFHTAAGLSVVTGDATEVTDSSAILHGQLVDFETEPIKEYGISYSTSPDDIQYISPTSLSPDGSFSVKIDGLRPETKYYYTAYAFVENDEEEYYGEAKNFTTEARPLCPDNKHPHMIDLGLGIKWACCNVGATKPEEFGGYYAWGETREKDWYSLKTYQHATEHSEHVDYSSFDGSFYYTINNIGDDISGTSFDAARVNWGIPWRIPTRNELGKLYANCSHEWTSINGVYGRIFTGPNGNRLFLPAAYDRLKDSTTPICHGENWDKYGKYWSSSHQPSDQDAWLWYSLCLSFSSGQGIISDYGIYNNTVWTGCSIRPVAE